VVDDAGATAWLSGPAVAALISGVSPVTRRNSESASRTPLGVPVWLPLVSSALQTAARIGDSTWKLFGVPLSQPAVGSGRPVPPRLTTVELWSTDCAPELQAVLVELLCNASAVSGPTLASATEESPCAV
jgi:hypothetical protein